jgi:hypothetical protein
LLLPPPLQGRATDYFNKSLLCVVVDEVDFEEIFVGDDAMAECEGK